MHRPFSYSVKQLGSKLLVFFIGTDMLFITVQNRCVKFLLISFLLLIILTF